jgi:tRNA nucleotidyltransferase (CCA-adding enzyme)
VVNSSPEEMLQKGFRQVGKNFPVFIDPKTKEEYALARKEKKTGPGHDGFSFEFSPEITLEEDLLRRDLTINAMAMDGDKLIDPYGGKSDLENKILKHVSKHFAEDPLRVLRVARFAALLEDFKIHPETLTLMKNMTNSGELKNLTPERVYMEMERAMAYPNPARFFEVLSDCDALKLLFPELENLKGVPQTEKYHPEGDAWIHTMLVLKAGCKLSKKPEVRFSCLLHDFGKGITPKDILPKHTGHETAGLPLIKDFCRRYKFPNKIRDLALKVCEFHLLSHKAFELKASTIIDLFTKINCFRDEEVLENFLLCSQADDMGKLSTSYPQAKYLKRCFEELKQLNLGELTKDLEGSLIKEKIRAARIELIKKVPKDIPE